MKLPNLPVHSLEDATHNFEVLQMPGSGLLPAGALMPYAGATAPGGFLLCDGSTYSPAAYPGLFAAISNAWGGTSAVPKLPDLRGRSPIGAGTGTAAGATAHTLGALPTTGAGGEETHMLSTGEMPSHTHPPASGTFFVESANAITVANGASQFSLNTIHAQTGVTGGGGAHNIMSPHAVVNFLIKT